VPWPICVAGRLEWYVDGDECFLARASAHAPRPFSIQKSGVLT
jgi:hypothetical protein